MKLIKHDSNYFSLDKYEFCYFHGSPRLEMGDRRNYVYAASIKDAIKLAKDALADIGKYRYRPVGQKLTARHGDYNFTEPNGVILNSREGGFNYDTIDSLYIEEELIPGKHVFALVAHWTDWGGTFGEDTNEASIVGLTYDQDKALDLEKWLKIFGNMEADYSAGGYARWQGYGCNLNSVSIKLLPVV